LREFIHVKDVYAYTGGLPTGCKLCIRGAKLVVFVTGLCDEACFYCPVSRRKLGRDVVYANEEKAKSLSDVVEEAIRVGAEGASITGGDPLIALGRTIRVIHALKEYGGPSFHIHLYTTGRYATSEAIRVLEEAGLDEIRFHVTSIDGVKAVEKAMRVRKEMDVGVEVPVFPDKVDELRRLILLLDRLGVDFINLNEAEVSPDNYDAIAVRGYQVRGVAVEGSYQAALNLVRWAAENTRRLIVHFCPARFKDRVQTRARLLRKAIRTLACYEELRPDGSVAVAVIRGNPTILARCCRARIGEYTLVAPKCASQYGLRYEVVELQPKAHRVRELESILGGS
jgi:pyruvate formate-lyase activating enzyme-like uncharacterized protein